MKKVIRLTESDLMRLVKRIIGESEDYDGYYDPEPTTKRGVARKWEESTDDSFYSEFLKKFPNKTKFERMFSKYDSEFSDYDDKLEMFIDEVVGHIPNNGVDDIEQFMNDLEKVNW
jgi:hypothetical protein